MTTVIAPAMRPTPDITIVTGGAGWLGTALVRALATHAGRWHRPGEIRALVRNRVEAERLRSVGAAVRPVIGDLLDPDSIGRLFADLGGSVDVVHSAGVIHPRRVAEFYEVNTDGTCAMIAASLDHGIRRFVHVSSNSPFGTNSHAGDRFRRHEPYHPYYAYGRSKMLAELAVFDGVARGLDAVIVRPPWFYGPHQPARQTTFFRLIRAGRFPVLGNGGQVRSMVYVGNLVDGVVRAELVATDPGRAWWIADARPYTIAEIVGTVGRALAAEGLEVSPPGRHLPDIVGRVAELSDATIQRFGRYQQQVHVLGELNKHIACEIAAACDELGYRPEIELAEGMRRSVRWCLDQGFEL